MAGSLLQFGLIDEGKNETKKMADAMFQDHPQQPAEIVSGRAEYRMDAVSQAPLEMTPIHSVV